MRVADAIADWLVERKITHAYGIIGGGNHILFDAISKKKELMVVCCHHEQAAAMASTYHNRIAGGLRSVVLVTTGAGSTNAITGVMAAWMDSIPLLVLSGNEASKYMNADTRVWGVQGYNSSGFVRSCTKLSGRYKEIFSLVPYLECAHSTAIVDPPGPVWIDIPKDLQASDA